MKLYIAGPMRTRPGLNFRAFDSAANTLRQKGHDVVNPAEHDRSVGVDPDRPHTWANITHELFRWDVAQILDCDGVAMLPGWIDSNGAVTEYALALATGKTVYRYESGLLWPVGPRRLIGLAGHARSGKDAAAAAIVKDSPLHWRRLAFADNLKALAATMLPPVDRQLALQCGWDDGLKALYRPNLQDLGSAGRSLLGANVWVSPVVSAMLREPGFGYVITDVRYPNEVDAIHDIGGTVVRIERPGVAPYNSHVSEQRVEVDHVIVNDGTLADLATKMRSYVRQGTC